MTGPVEVQIDERTVRRLSGVRVGVYNVLERGPIEGSDRAGPSARLAVGEAPGPVVGSGSRLQVGGATWEVLEVVPGDGATGHVRLRLVDRAT